MRKNISVTFKAAMLGALLFSGSVSADNGQSICTDVNEVSYNTNLSNTDSCSVAAFAGAEYSAIYNFKIIDATTISFDYNTPDDGDPGRVLIWNESLDVDLTRAPDFSASLSKNKGHYVLSSPKINFQQGIYTIAITAGKATNTVSATQSMIVGQPAHSGRSTIVVTAKTLTRITAVFNSPANVNAGENLTWFRLFEGEQLGGGNLMAEQRKPPLNSSGLVSVEFPAGTLRNGSTYTLVLNPGPTIKSVSAAYTFKYILQ